MTTRTDQDRKALVLAEDSAGQALNTNVQGTTARTPTLTHPTISLSNR